MNTDAGKVVVFQVLLKLEFKIIGIIVYML